MDKKTKNVRNLYFRKWNNFIIRSRLPSNKRIDEKIQELIQIKFSKIKTKGDYDFENDIIKLRPFYSNIRDF